MIIRACITDNNLLEVRMSIRKKFLKSKPMCKVTFTFSRNMSNGADSVFLVGEFNDWNETSHPMKQKKDGNFNLTIDLEKDREYEFRYLLDGNVWENDDCADKYVNTPYGSDNSVINT